MYDGSVYVVAQGDEKNIDIFKEYLKKGPNFSNVERIKIEVVYLEDKYNNFNIEV